MRMRIYLKHFLAIFILLWTLSVFYIFVYNDESKSTLSERRSNQKVRDNLNGKDPSKEFEEIRRKVFNDIQDMSFFVNSQLTLLIESDSIKDKKLVFFKENLKERIDVLIGEVYNLSLSKGMGEQRRRQATEVAEQVQKRLRELQNPTDCSQAKKIVCDMSKVCGFGCQMHHILYCFIVAWYTDRILILNSKGWSYNRAGIEAYFKPISDTCQTNEDETIEWLDEKRNEAKAVRVSSFDSKQEFMPQAVPKELVEKIARFHGDPFVWWAGQILSYLMRFNDEFDKIVQTAKQELKFSTPCVGVHVRRTDKIGTEAAFHDVAEYMQHVDEFFRLHELRTGKSNLVRTVYLASDEPKVFAEAQAKYPAYRFIFDKKNAETAQVFHRYTPNSAKGIILDTYFLSQCDYLVCTLSSTVCRLVYQLMQTRFADASWRFRSLDDVYFFGGQNPHKVVAVFDHKPMRPEEIEIRRGDMINLAGNHWDGYSKGLNKRTKQEGLFPSYKVKNVFTTF